MQKAYLNPTPDQTFEIVGDGPYNFTRVLAHTRELEAAGNVEDACNERYQAFQRLAGLLPEDEEINLEWSHRNSQSALELIRASAIDHFLINDFEMSAALLEMLLELDPEDHLEGSELLAFDYLAMDEQELFDLRRSLETIRDIVRFLQQSDEEEETENSPYPALRELAGDILVFPQLIARIDSILDKFGKIKDNASAELLRIRRELSATTGSISRSLNSILRAAQSEGYVDKDVTPTMRDGRLVIPVAPGMKRKIRGIVHDESATGKTVFIEPAEVVEANNRIRELEGEERREIIRILTEFSATVRPQVPALLSSYEFLAEIDFIRAKALFGIDIKGLKPSFENKQIVDWFQAVHPLLQMSLAKHDKKVVPLDIILTRDKRILLISGPNAGGKSVCLKTVGLLQDMLQ